MAHPQDAGAASRRRGGATTLALVVVFAGIAAAARLPAIGWSLRPDESGFTMVARAWDPQPDSPYGAYWVDRPPLLIALFRVADGVGGPFALRWTAVLGSAIFVLAAAGVALEVARTGPATPRTTGRAVVLTAVAGAAYISNPSIDLVSAKGEILAVPVITAGMWLLLRAARTGSAWAAAAAGLLGAVAVGLKQNLVAVLVFGMIYLIVHAARRRTPWRQAGRLGTALLGGAAVPVIGTVAWSVATSVGPLAVWEATFGFRAEAVSVIAEGPLRATAARAADLVGVLISSFSALLFLWFALSLRRLAPERPEVLAATVAVLLVDGATLVLGGSFWRPYLFALAPGVVLAIAVLASGGGSQEGVVLRSRLVTVTVVAAMVAGSVVSAVRWSRAWPGASHQSTAAKIGRAVGASSRPGDTLTVFGGRADVQLASGLRSPYAYLWSLPARARDAGSDELAQVMSGPDAPTWVLVWTPIDTWRDGSQDRLAPVLDERYVRVSTACGRKPLYRLREEVRPPPPVSCAQLRAAREEADSDP